MTKGSLRKTIFKFPSHNWRFPTWVFLLAVFPSLLIGNTTFAGPSEIDRGYHQAKTLLEFQKIAEKIQKLIEKEPNESEWQWRLSRSHYSMAKKSADEDTKNLHYDLCIDLSSQALEFKPNSAISFFYRGLCRGKQGEMKGIWASLGIIEPFEEDMKKAMKLDPTIEQGGPHRALGKLYLELPFFLGGNNNQAVFHLEQAVRLGPEYAENHLGLAQAYYAKNNLISARKSLLTLMRLTNNVSDDEDLLSIRTKGQKLMNKLTK
jgi:tetratricopeptide (TPR) repeat protein